VYPRLSDEPVVDVVVVRVDQQRERATAGKPLRRIERRQMLEIAAEASTPTSNLDLEPRTSNLSNLEPRTSNLEPRTSIL
jgi:hypothetical protein